MLLIEDNPSDFILSYCIKLGYSNTANIQVGQCPQQTLNTKI